MSELLFEARKVRYYAGLFYDNLKLKRDKANFIVGESGSGKSTFLKLLNHSISPLSGQLLYKGKEIKTYEPIALRREVSLVAQEVFLMEGSILDNFRQFYALRKEAAPKDEVIRYMTELCCINLSLDQDVATLSGGERQRVYIAIFLSLYPKVILLDEPTSALDEKNSYRLMENIIAFCKKNTIDMVLVSHNKNIVENFCENKIEIIKRPN